MRLTANCTCYPERDGKRDTDEEQLLAVHCLFGLWHPVEKVPNIFANKFNIQNILHKWLVLSSGLMLLRRNAYTKKLSAF